MIRRRGRGGRIDVFRKGKSEFLAVTENKLKENGEVWCRVNGITAGI